MDRINKIYRLVGEELSENHLNKDQGKQADLAYNLIKCLAVVVYSTLKDEGIDIFINELQSVFEDQVIHLKETHRLLYEETEGGLH